MAYLEKDLDYSSKDILGNVRRTAKALLQQALLGASQDKEDNGVDTLIKLRVLVVLYRTATRDS